MIMGEEREKLFIAQEGAMIYVQFYYHPYLTFFPRGVEQSYYGEILTHMRPKNCRAPHTSMYTQTAHPWSKFQLTPKNEPKQGPKFAPHLGCVGVVVCLVGAHTVPRSGE